jgi:DnaJ-class molecular chaperone
VRMSQGFFSVQQTCPRCKGRGQSFQPCDSCHGRPHVARDADGEVPAGVTMATASVWPAKARRGAMGDLQATSTSKSMSANTPSSSATAAICRVKCPSASRLPHSAANSRSPRLMVT